MPWPCVGRVSLRYTTIAIIGRPQCRRIAHDPDSQRIEIDVGHRFFLAQNARQAFITAMHAIEEKPGGKNRNVRQGVKLKS